MVRWSQPEKSGRKPSNSKKTITTSAAIISIGWVSLHPDPKVPGVPWPIDSPSTPTPTILLISWAIQISRPAKALVLSAWISKSWVTCYHLRAALSYNWISWRRGGALMWSLEQLTQAPSVAKPWPPTSTSQAVWVGPPPPIPIDSRCQFVSQIRRVLALVMQVSTWKLLRAMARNPVMCRLMETRWLMKKRKRVVLSKLLK